VPRPARAARHAPRPGAIIGAGAGIIGRSGETAMRANALKTMMKAGRPVLVGWAGLGSGYAAEVLGHGGVDGVCVDLQHGPVFLDRAVEMLIALSATPAVPLARPSGNDFAEINKLLDAGAYGVIVPLIDTAEDARRLVEAVRYPPRGRRSFGPARGLLYGGADYAARADEEMLAFAMIETPRGLAHLDAIAAVEGLDGLFIGPTDLSLALGQPPAPKWREEPLRGAIARIQAAARANGKFAGIFCTSPEMGADMLAAGFDMVVPGNDATLLRNATQAWCDAIRGETGSGPKPGY
jgi:4-hydroxy-2-oxoheptanedioate aldolase